MKKEGDKVVIRDEEWFKGQKKTMGGVVEIDPYTVMTKKMQPFMGMEATIVEVNPIDGKTVHYKLDVDQGNWNWSEGMFV